MSKTLKVMTQIGLERLHLLQPVRSPARVWYLCCSASSSLWTDHTGYYTSAPAVPQGCTQPVQSYSTSSYDGTPAPVTSSASQSFYGSHPGYGASPAYPAYGQQTIASIPNIVVDGNKPQENVQPTPNTGYDQTNLAFNQSNYPFSQVPGSYPLQLGAQSSYTATSYSASSQPSSYEQTTYSQTSRYSQPSVYGQTSSYNQQSIYSQQGNCSPPPSGSFAQQPLRQYSAYSTSDNYLQHSSYRPEPTKNRGKVFSGPEQSGFLGPGQSSDAVGVENRSRCRGGLDRDCISLNIERRRGRGGVSIAGDRDGFIKPSDALDNSSGPVSALEETESGSATIYIQGLNDKVMLEEIADFFKHCGDIKIRRSGQPAINIYMDKETGKPKGDATLSYADPKVARAAVDQFNGKDFQGNKLKVSVAHQKAFMGGTYGSMFPRDGRGQPPGHGSMMDRGGDRGGLSQRGSFRGGRRRSPSGGNAQQRAGDWQCPNLGCGNKNFAWRTECNQCKAPKPEGFCPPPFYPPGGNRGGGIAGMHRGRSMEFGGRGGRRTSGGGDQGGGLDAEHEMDRERFRGVRSGSPPIEPMRNRRRRGGTPGKMQMKGDHRQDRRDRPY
ncbi:EWS RNA-binding protein 1a isoform X2 [Polypterus senegalus]|uniref:EWS RNA-binding protein 1a isoform X2 n=1 Tax=Polypterus senegalus TaxID=55291 RepID=UPI00196285A3|nr:EWS RNA-binding protein 1a isoform X2 [Polypterus senegalus]